MTAETNRNNSQVGKHEYLCFPLTSENPESGATAIFAADFKTFQAFTSNEQHKYDVRKVPEGFVYTLQD